MPVIVRGWACGGLVVVVVEFVDKLVSSRFVVSCRFAITAYVRPESESGGSKTRLAKRKGGRTEAEKRATYRRIEIGSELDSTLDLYRCFGVLVVSCLCRKMLHGNAPGPVTIFLLLTTRAPCTDSSGDLGTQHGERCCQVFSSASLTPFAGWERKC